MSGDSATGAAYATMATSERLATPSPGYRTDHRPAAWPIFSAPAGSPRQCQSGACPTRRKAGAPRCFRRLRTLARRHGTYEHVSGVFLGNAGFMAAGNAAGYAVTALGNKARRNQAQAEAMRRWREYQPSRVIATDQRLICLADGQWLSFYFSAVSAFFPEPETLLARPRLGRHQPPLLLTGPHAPPLAVYATRRLHSVQSIGEHPAMAQFA